MNFKQYIKNKKNYPFILLILVLIIYTFFKEINNTSYIFPITIWGYIDPCHFCSILFLFYLLYKILKNITGHRKILDGLFQKVIYFLIAFIALLCIDQFICYLNTQKNYYNNTINHQENSYSNEKNYISITNKLYDHLEDRFSGYSSWIFHKTNENEGTLIKSDDGWHFRVGPSKSFLFSRLFNPAAIKNLEDAHDISESLFENIDRFFTEKDFSVKTYDINSNDDLLYRQYESNDTICSISEYHYPYLAQAEFSCTNKDDYLSNYQELLPFMQALGDKYALVTIESKEKNSVRLAIGPIYGGGSFGLASNKSGEWEIFYTGQDQPNCDDLIYYDFSTSIYSACYTKNPNPPTSHLDEFVRASTIKNDYCSTTYNYKNTVLYICELN